MVGRGTCSAGCDLRAPPLFGPLPWLPRSRWTSLRPHKMDSAWQGVLGSRGGWPTEMGGTQVAGQRWWGVRDQNTWAGLNHVPGGAGTGPASSGSTERTGWGHSVLSPDTGEQGWWPTRRRSKLKAGSLGEGAPLLSSLGVEGIRAPWKEIDEARRGSG